MPGWDPGRGALDETIGSDRLISLTRTDEPRRYFSLDGLGSVVNLTDDSGNEIASYHLDAWGNFRFPTELNDSANRFAFTGHIWDEETGLYNAKARYFDPKLGRFLTQDSYLGEIDDPPSLHRYLYANDNPTTFVDPTGHAALRVATDMPADDVVGSDAALQEAKKTLEQAAAANPQLAGPGSEAAQRTTEPVVVTEQRSETCRGALCPVIEPLLEGAGWLYENTLGRLESWAGRQGVKAGAKVRERIESQEPSEHLLKYRREMTKDLPPEILAVDQGTQQLGTKGKATAAELGEAGTSKAVKQVAVVAVTTAIAVGMAKASGAAEGLSVSAPSTAGGQASRGAGTYRSVKGHHVHAKKGLEGHGRYDFREAFSVSDDLLREHGVRHADITPIQQRLFRELQKSGGPNNLTQHTRIAYQALVEAGIPKGVAKDWVGQSLKQLVQRGVTAPTKMPWPVKNK